ncbi:MAG: tRNA (adenosine(37)-N6)-threonylcarbamoyltransferase complex ATPase subunit type 1 TsaE [Ktedonobacteraceae bacterium]|nr:tRNA (adenosine(37)-N6)-threonylcarbamoyltransferase complex ATPase subunit type 1 TsaE [Ktedonobacteraceae bacterium]MBV9712584.1 tRNA (adenosine(37)-N6)-threonylcarbamoyltransferase complex ATPase subunit type 1 TsaE [Ktedonobacteraceae bacterium]
MLVDNTQEDVTCTLDIVSHSSAQTQRLGMRLGDLLRGGELLLLEGQLGSGKTTFTQGLAMGMGISELVSSPTFTLLKEYSGQRSPSNAPAGSASQRGPALYHFDLYRLDDPEEILDLGFEDYFYDGSGVCVVEWADKAAALWSDGHLCIRLKLMSETKRSLLLIATGARYCELLRQFQKNTYATASS